MLLQLPAGGLRCRHQAADIGWEAAIASSNTSKITGARMYFFRDIHGELSFISILQNTSWIHFGEEILLDSCEYYGILNAGCCRG